MRVQSKPFDAVGYYVLDWARVTMLLEWKKRSRAFLVSRRGRWCWSACLFRGRPQTGAALFQLGVERGERLAPDLRVVSHVTGHRVHRNADYLVDAGCAEPDHRDVGQPFSNRTARLAAGLEQLDSGVQGRVPHVVDRLARRQKHLAKGPQHFVRHPSRVL